MPRLWTKSPSLCLTSNLPTKSFLSISYPPIHATSPKYVNVLHLIMLRPYGEEYKL